MTVSGDTRDGVPFKSDSGIIAYLGTVAIEQERRAVIEPADVRAFLGVGWSNQEIHARVSRVAHCTFEMPETDKPCQCTDDKCRGNRRQIRVADSVYVCRASGRSHVSFTPEFMIEARSGAQLGVGMVRHLAGSPAVFSFVVAIILHDPHATALELPVKLLRALMQLPKDNARARQSIGFYADHANGCQLGWSLEFDARRDVLIRVRVENRGGASDALPLPTGDRPSGDGAQPGDHSAPDGHGEVPTAHRDRHTVDRRTPQERRAEHDRWLSAALLGDFEPRSRQQVTAVPPWAAPSAPPPSVRGEPTAPRARGEPTPAGARDEPTVAASTPTEAEIVAARSVMAMIGAAFSMGFMPGMRGPGRRPPNGASRAPTKARSNSLPRPPPPPPPPGVVTEIEDIKFVDGVMVEAPWLNRRRATPCEAPAQRESGPDPPPGDDPDSG